MLQIRTFWRIWNSSLRIQTGLHLNFQIFQRNTTVMKMWKMYKRFLVDSEDTITSVMWSRNYLFPLRLRLSKSFGSGSRSGNSFGTTFFHRFYIIKYIFHVFMKENRPNSHTRSYSIWILIFFTTLTDPEPKLLHSGSGSSQKFRLLAAPAPGPQHWIIFVS